MLYKTRFVVEWFVWDLCANIGVSRIYRLTTKSKLTHSWIFLTLAPVTFYNRDHNEQLFKYKSDHVIHVQLFLELQKTWKLSLKFAVDWLIFVKSNLTWSRWMPHWRDSFNWSSIARGIFLSALLMSYFLRVSNLTFPFRLMATVSTAPPCSYVMGGVSVQQPDKSARAKFDINGK